MAQWVKDPGLSMQQVTAVVRVQSMAWGTSICCGCGHKKPKTLTKICVWNVEIFFITQQ